MKSHHSQPDVQVKEPLLVKDIVIDINPPTPLSVELLFIIMDYLDVETGREFASFSDHDNFLEKYCGSKDNLRHFEESLNESITFKESTAWLKTKLLQVVSGEYENRKKLYQTAELKKKGKYALLLALSTLVFGGGFYAIIEENNGEELPMLAGAVSVFIGFPVAFVSLMCLLIRQHFNENDLLDTAFDSWLPYVFLDETDNTPLTKEIIQKIAKAGTSVQDMIEKLDNPDLSQLMKYHKHSFLFRDKKQEKPKIEVIEKINYCQHLSK